MAKKVYTTDGKVAHYSKEQDINNKLSKILGKKFIDYRKTWDAANRFEILTEFPLFLHFDMNQRCNYRCPQCILAYPDELKKYYQGDDLDFNTFKLAIDEAETYKCPSMSVQGNNEPLLNPKLEEYISYAYNHGFIDIMFNTNGSLLFKERAKKLLDSGVTRLRFSLDAFTEETYSAIRVGGNYSKVLKNIESFLEEKRKGGYDLPVTGVSFVLQKKNYKELDDFIEYWSSRVDMVTIQNFMPPTPGKDFSDFYAPREAYPSANISSNEGFKCVQPYQRLVIKNNDITPCCLMYSTALSLGKFPETSLYDAWNSEKMKFIQKIHSQGRYQDDPICKLCVKSMFSTSSNNSRETDDLLM
ncbi:MAG: radical SAM protein [Prochlorococcus marinus CUG1439]|uniref:radical SAM/SPASM domain-containing protein n=1 Tax=Prochlorococcus sp. MIT 1314 TaxID=3096220 RepID=UPI001B20CA62|nr:radical SAM/SPASM domain-containing protein [Prochlorococcus sp. MIT 1314]MCR8539427.1 radical SAM protein [Prochlorococcus marinus CUG1439]